MNTAHYWKNYNIEPFVDLDESKGKKTKKYNNPVESAKINYQLLNSIKKQSHEIKEKIREQ
jgi:hypothetical protein